jgi:hypothetical protein
VCKGTEVQLVSTVATPKEDELWLIEPPFSLKVGVRYAQKSEKVESDIRGRATC